MWGWEYSSLFAASLERPHLRSGSASLCGKEGFTLIELVVTLIIVGIVAVVAMPRMSDTKDFDARSYHDQVISMLRYAQKVAIAQRISVFVNLTASGDAICLTYIADTDCTSGAGVLNPANQQWFKKTPPAGVILSPSSSFAFSPLGSPIPDPGAAITLTINGGGVARLITIERDTGYVH